MLIAQKEVSEHSVLKTEHVLEMPVLGNFIAQGQSIGLIVNFLMTMKMLPIHVTIRRVISRYSNWV